MVSTLGLGYTILVLFVAIVGVVGVLFVSPGESRNAQALTVLGVVVFLLALGVEMLA
ncbi:hypothetical protein ACFQJD_13605 [Haloplanus sp. GCM10025708]|uniref:hypothetical protein n=1 Tax=Haloferacaceae TaxID=1644056 RepID=UPI003623C9F1